VRRGVTSLTRIVPNARWMSTLMKVIEHGLIVMVGDNDAGGVSTYAQAGQDFGYSLLWTLVLLIPVLIVNQEMVVRLGAVTGVDTRGSSASRFGRFWGLVFGGRDLPPQLSDHQHGVHGHQPGGPVLWVEHLARRTGRPRRSSSGITVSGNFRRWERAMFVFLFASLLVLPAGAAQPSRPRRSAQGLSRPASTGRADLKLGAPDRRPWSAPPSPPGSSSSSSRT